MTSHRDETIMTFPWNPLTALRLVKKYCLGLFLWEFSNSVAIDSTKQKKQNSDSNSPLGFTCSLKPKVFWVIRLSDVLASNLFYDLEKLTRNAAKVAGYSNLQQWRSNQIRWKACQICCLQRRKRSLKGRSGVWPNGLMLGMTNLCRMTRKRIWCPFRLP